MDELLQAKNSIDAAKNIGILTKMNASDDAIATALALFFALKNINKKVFFALDYLPEKISSMLGGKQQKKLHVSFNEEVSEVYYEKREKGIDLYLVPKSGNADAEKFSCKVVSGLDYITSDNSPDFDLLITIGIDEFSDVEKLCEKNLDQLYACTILNIDNNLANQNYGEINIIKDKESLSQGASCLIKYLGGEFLNREAANFLLYGLTSSPTNTTNKKNIPTIKWLFKHGGDFSVSAKAKNGGYSPQVKMLEDIFRNLNFFEEEGIYASEVSESEMKKNGATPKDLAFAVEKIKTFFRIPSLLLLWESHASPVTVKGIFYADRKNLLQKITDNFKGSSKGMGTMFLTEESSLDSAKEKVLSYLLKK
jgi:hypothetical protein